MEGGERNVKIEAEYVRVITKARPRRNAFIKYSFSRW